MTDFTMTTARLTLRKPASYDAQWIYELNNDPENARRIEAEWFHNVKLGIDHQVKNTPTLTPSP